jgi:hypothetical protein
LNNKKNNNVFYMNTLYYKKYIYLQRKL